MTQRKAAAAVVQPTPLHHPPTTTTTTTVHTNSNTTTQIPVAYAVSVTGCGSDPITEGGAVLAHSIRRAASLSSTSSTYSVGGIFALVHPSALECAQALEAVGYTVLVRETPVAVDEIQGEYLRSHIEANGCCGEKELIKLEAYTLTDYPLVVHLDLDVLVLQPLDTVFDLLLSPERVPEEQIQQTVQRKDRLPKGSAGSIQAAFTMDYNMVQPHVQYKPVQGGFLIIQPSLDVYQEYKDIIQKGDFRKNGGWGGQVGPFYGSMTFQGIIPYYYHVLHPGTSVELNRCQYNQMCDNPRTGRTKNDIVSGDCRTGESECTDCRTVPLESVVTTHFTLCQKPWWCLQHGEDAVQHRLCRKLTHAWYQIRSEMEQSWGRSGTGSGTYQPEQFYGYCASSGKKGYLPIAKPFGKAITDGAGAATA